MQQITLALARLPAGDPGRRIGPLFPNPGGPGGSGVDLVLEAGPFLSADEVRARFDPAGNRRVEQGRPDPADAQEAAGRLSDHPATLVRHGG